MIDERLEAQASLYALDALPPDEAREFERALRTDLQLQLLVKELRGTADVMAVAFPPVPPPAGLKARILAAIDQRPAAAGVVPVDFSVWQTWVPWALAASFAILCMVLLWTGHSLRREVGDLQQRMDDLAEQTHASEQQRQQMQTVVEQAGAQHQQRVAELQTQINQRAQETQRERTRLEDQLKQTTSRAAAERVQLQQQVRQQQDLIDGLQELVATSASGLQDRFARTRVAPLGPTPDGSARSAGAVAFDTLEQQGVVEVSNLAPLRDHDYQLWLFDPRFGTPVSGGVFNANAQGRVRFQYRPAIAIESVDRFAVSIERKGGVPAPQGKVVLASSL